MTVALWGGWSEDVVKTRYLYGTLGELILLILPTDKETPSLNLSMGQPNSQKSSDVLFLLHRCFFVILFVATIPESVEGCLIHMLLVAQQFLYLGSVQCVPGTLLANHPGD